MGKKRIKEFFYRASFKFPVLKTTNFFLRSLISNLNIHRLEKDEFGICPICGRFSRFYYKELLDKYSYVVSSCGFDDNFTEVLNITNTLKCGHCGAKYRVRCAAESLLNHLFSKKVRSIDQLVSMINSRKILCKILETASYGGIFSKHKNIKEIILSDYLDNIERGKYEKGVRSEDLQCLTFDSNTFDALIALDVLEHVADPWIAFSEIQRVLKPGGVGIITVPIDIRNPTTKTIAAMENGKITYSGLPAYHLDPLRESGALVFIEFGMDIIERLTERGCNASWDIYQTKHTGIIQHVILIRKSK